MNKLQGIIIFICIIVFTSGFAIGYEVAPKEKRIKQKLLTFQEELGLVFFNYDNSLKFNEEYQIYQILWKNNNWLIWFKTTQTIGEIRGYIIEWNYQRMD